MVRPQFAKGENVLYYGSVVTILSVNNNGTAYVKQGKEKFIVDFSLLKKKKVR